MSGTYLCPLFISHSQNFRICYKFSHKFYYDWKSEWNFTVVLLKIFWRVCKVFMYWTLLNCDCFIFEFSKLTLSNISDYSFITFIMILLCFWSMQTQNCKCDLIKDLVPLWIHCDPESSWWWYLIWQMARNSKEITVVITWLPP